MRFFRCGCFWGLDGTGVLCGIEAGRGGRGTFSVATRLDGQDPMPDSCAHQSVRDFLRQLLWPLPNGLAANAKRVAEKFNRVLFRSYEGHAYC